jgi:hypothetical protein
MTKKITVIEGGLAREKEISNQHNPLCLIGVVLGQDDQGNKQIRHPLLGVTEDNPLGVMSICAYDANKVWADFFAKCVEANKLAQEAVEASELEQTVAEKSEDA